MTTVPFGVSPPSKPTPAPGDDVRWLRSFHFAAYEARLTWRALAGDAAVSPTDRRLAAAEYLYHLAALQDLARDALDVAVDDNDRERHLEALERVQRLAAEVQVVI